MIEWLTKLPKLIDAFISGVIEFCYRFLGAALLVSRRPVGGTRELEPNEEQLSSRTMLFGAATFFIFFVVFSISNTGALSGAGLMHFFALIVLLYVFFDALAAIAARFCASRPDAEPADKQRDYLRYAFAASLVLLALGSMIFFGIADYVAAATRKRGAVPMDAKFVALGALTFGLFAMLPLGFYQPAALIVGTLKSVRSRFFRGLLILVISAPLAIFFAVVMSKLLLSYGRIRDAVDGPIFVTPVKCTVEDGGLRAVIAVENASVTTTYLSQRSLRVRLAYDVRPGETREAALERSSEEVEFSGIEDDVAIVEPRGHARIVGEARPASPAWRKFVAGGRTGACQLTVGESKRTVMAFEPAPLEPEGPAPDAAASTPASAKR